MASCWTWIDLVPLSPVGSDRTMPRTFVLSGFATGGGGGGLGPLAGDPVETARDG